MPSNRPKGGYYAVNKGRFPGVYNSWHECEAQVKGFAGARFKRFFSMEEAALFAYGVPLADMLAREPEVAPPPRVQAPPAPIPEPIAPAPAALPRPETPPPMYTLYADSPPRIQSAAPSSPARRQTPPSPVAPRPRHVHSVITVPVPASQGPRYAPYNIPYPQTGASSSPARQQTPPSSGAPCPRHVRSVSPVPAPELRKPKSLLLVTKHPLLLMLRVYEMCAQSAQYQHLGDLDVRLDPTPHIHELRARKDAPYTIPQSQPRTPPSSSPARSSSPDVPHLQDSSHAGPSSVLAQPPRHLEPNISESLPVADLGWDVAFTAGFCTGTDGSSAEAGLGVWWGRQDPRNLSEKCYGKQTSQQAELLSILRLLETTEITQKPLLIRTTSYYCISCFKGQVQVWKANNWQTSSGRPVKNRGILRCISKYLEARANFGQQVVIAYVQCRNADVGNDCTKALAKLGAASAAQRQEPDWDALEDILERQLNRTIVGLGRGAVETEVLGPEDVTDNVLIEMRTKDKLAVKFTSADAATTI
ncbi:hypothetical protein GALMADRAFT_211655 [Galerina marginata CBS 339.88]|uniref:Ribonuclease H n=1 Tax=Galerina marginata (strain CBS 339.88) TaxID=685588 RepID=A0A067SX48_GALM3|nr:hypothetical protein GALMADRAFT_211655 [Galerina marginata CBS 339.88]